MGWLRDELTRRAVTAAVAVARAHGVRCAAPEVLANKANTLVRLAPAPFVARVATTTGLLRGGARDALAREVALARYLAEAGAPVVPPAGALPPGPHVRDGLAMTLWPYFPAAPDGPQTPGPDRFGGMLRELHDVLAGYPGPLPYLGTPYGDIAAVLDGALPPGAAPELTAGRRRELGERFARLRVALDGRPGRPLHGDAHPGNLLPTRHGWRWNDLEDTCAGPVEWDLACLLRSSRIDGAAAVRAYGRDPGDPRLEPLRELRALHGELYGRMVAVYRG